MPGRKLAILIGNRVFPDSSDKLPSLQCPVRDAEGLGKLLAATEHGGYVITLLADSSSVTVKRSLYAVLKEATPADQVVIYYSGHGKLDEDGELHLATADTIPSELPPTSIPIQELRRYVNASSAGRVIVILDCCYSGAVTRLFKGEVAEQAQESLRTFEGSGRAYLSASTDVQVAEEKEGDEYSLLTKHIIEGIRSGDADENDDGCVSFSELYKYVQRKVRAEGRQQPRAWVLDQEGDVIVALTGRPALEARREAVRRKFGELLSAGLIPQNVVLYCTEALYSQSVENGPQPFSSAFERLYPLINSAGEFQFQLFELTSTARTQREAEETRKAKEAEAEAQEAQRQADAEARRKAEAQQAQRQKAEVEEAQRQADAEARRKAEAKKAQRQKAEAQEAQRQADAEVRRKAEAQEAERQADAEVRRKAEAQEAQRQADAEARRKAEAQQAQRQKAEVEEAQRQADAEVRRKAEAQEAQRQADAEVRRKAEAQEAQRQADAEARRKAEAQQAQRQKAEVEEAQRQADAEARRKAAEVEEFRPAVARRKTPQELIDELPWHNKVGRVLLVTAMGWGFGFYLDVLGHTQFARWIGAAIMFVVIVWALFTRSGD